MRDERLMQLIGADPDRGMRKLYESYSGLVFSIVRSRLRPPAFCEADIEDCIADTFSEFYLDRAKFDPARGSIKSWIAKIAINNVFDMLKKRKIEIVPLEAAAELISGADTAAEFEDRAEREALLGEIEKLGSPDRDIIIRKYLLGQPSKKIARELGLSVSNVDTRAHRAVLKLRAALAETGENGNEKQS